MNTAAPSITILVEKYWDKVLPDVLVFILYSFCLEPMMAWQLAHPALSCTLLMLLNTAAVSFGCLSFFSLYADDDKLLSYKNSLLTWESAMLGLSVFISVFGFFWWLVPFAVVKKLGVTDTGFLLGMTAYFICFMAVVANASGNTKGIKLSDTALVKGANVFITTIFFFFSYSFLLMTMQQSPEKGPGQELLGLICLLVFFLPLRLFLLLRPPRSRSEYLLFLFSFGYMLYTLFAND